MYTLSIAYIAAAHLQCPPLKNLISAQGTAHACKMCEVQRPASWQLPTPTADREHEGSATPSAATAAPAGSEEAAKPSNPISKPSRQILRRSYPIDKASEGAAPPVGLDKAAKCATPVPPAKGAQDKQGGAGGSTAQRCPVSVPPKRLASQTPRQPPRLAAAPASGARKRASAVPQVITLSLPASLLFAL